MSNNYISISGNIINRDEIHFIQKMYRYDNKFIIPLQLKYKDNSYSEKTIYIYNNETGYNTRNDGESDDDVNKRNSRIETKIKNEYDRLCRHLITNNQADDKMFFHSINLKK